MPVMVLAITVSWENAFFEKRKKKKYQDLVVVVPAQFSAEKYCNIPFKSFTILYPSHHLHMLGGAR